jgi:hypothetical protein
MKIDVKVDASAVVKLAETVFKKLPCAVNDAITRMAKEAVLEGQKELAADLQIRKRFILNRLKILQYSKVGNLTAVIGIDPDVQGSPLILGFLEEGGTKEPSAGSEIAIPLTGEAARPSFPQSVPTSLRYKNLNFQNRKGKKKTYIVPGVGIFQRVGVGDSPDATNLIYSFKPSAPLRKELHVRDVMLRAIAERFATIFNEEFTKTILRKASQL